MPVTFVRSAEFDARMMALLSTGMPMRAVASVLGVSRSSVQRWAYELRTGLNPLTGQVRAGGAGCASQSPFARATELRREAGEEPLPPGHPIPWQAIMLPCMAPALFRAAAGRRARLQTGGGARRAVLARLAASGVLARANAAAVDTTPRHPHGYDTEASVRFDGHVFL